jgi:hypothetical protein
MDFSLKTKHLKETSKLTLSVDGPKEVIDRIEAAIHESLGSVPVTINLNNFSKNMGDFEQSLERMKRPEGCCIGNPDTTTGSDPANR